MPKRHHHHMAPTSEDERIRTLALRFAAEVARIVRTGIAREVTAQVSHLLEGISRGEGASAVRLLAQSGKRDRRIGKAPVPVRCPVPGCHEVGIRAKRNFCATHSSDLSETEKARLRDAQAAEREGDEAPASGRRSRAARKAGARTGRRGGKTRKSA
jgi:hypothetical protein